MVLSSACAGSRGGGQVEPTQSVSTMLSREQAIEVGLRAADHLIGDSEVRKTDAEALSYSRALSKLVERGLADPSGLSLANNSVLWLVSLTGQFKEPVPGQASGAFTPSSIECSEIVVVVDDATGQPIRLTLSSVDSCS